MLDILFKINSLITNRQRRGIIILVILLFIGMILEVFGLGIIIPMINILIDPEMVENNFALMTLKDFFPNFSHIDFVFFFLGVILFLYVIKTLYQVFLTYKQNTFLNNVVATISNNLFASYLKRPYNFHLNSNASGLIKNLQVEVNYFFAFLSSLISLVLELGFLFAIIMTLIFIEPIGAISIGVFYGFLSILFFQFTKKKLGKWGELREKFDVIVSKTLFEGLGGIKDLLILKSQIFKDNRGSLKETFRKNVLKKDFPFDIVSLSKKNVIRGLHFQKKFSQAKLITVAYGKILDVAVDLRKNSKNYGESFCIELDDVKNQQLFIPKGFAHGFLVLSESAKVCYKVDNFYNPDAECGLNYNDPLLNIDWKINSDLIIVNKKDTNYPLFNSKNHFGG